MKIILTLILTVLLLGMAPAPCVFAAEESAFPVFAQVTTPAVAVTTPAVAVTTPTVAVTTEKIILSSFDEPKQTDAVAFAVGTSQDEIIDWFSSSVMGFSGYDVDGNYYDMSSGKWNVDAVETAAAGIYYAFTSPDLGREYTLAEDLSLPRQLCAVSIQALGEPDINCFVSGRGFVHFPWVLSAEQEEGLDEFSVWLRQDGGEWTSLNDGFLLISDGLQISQRVFTYGSTYELKVKYPGGQTGILTFKYDGELSIINYLSGDRDGGDVNGTVSGTGTQPAPTTPQAPDNPNGDNNQKGDNYMPAPSHSSSETEDTSHTEDNSQIEDIYKDYGINSNNNNLQIQVSVIEKPATEDLDVVAESALPVPSNTLFSSEEKSTSSAQKNDKIPQQKHKAQALTDQMPDYKNTLFEKSPILDESFPVIESYSPAQTVISGRRLKDLCKEGESVVFGSGDLTVSIPSELLLGLNLSESDTLTVRLTQKEGNQIILTVGVSDKSLMLLSGTVLRLRYIPQSENADITIRNDSGEEITDISYDGELLRFAADTSGTYTITEQLRTQEMQKSMSPLLLTSWGLILAVGGIRFFRRKYNG
ncbi:hypothetical protein [Proteocatella sphenisci]|uniref:hypothetical protein n=1 Tax=Proteocatella sphenisci TaxID=181070 RepID=UPI0004B22B2D|nr:hypothetical protein [Proteocatella sphenisci]